MKPSSDHAEEIADLQSRLLFQEDLLNTLNEQVSEQNKELSQFHILLQHLNQKIKQLQHDDGDNGSDIGREPPPPHY